MRGIYSELPADTLAAALAPIAELSSSFAWAVAIQSGLIQHGNDDDEIYDCWVRVVRGDVEPANRMKWLEPGFLPKLANRLVIDEWTYYLGFDPCKVSAKTIAEYLGHDIHPHPTLFEAIARFNLIYILRVDTGWWEAYTSNGNVLKQLREGWNGTNTDSERWDGNNVIHPGQPHWFKDNNGR